MIFTNPTFLETDKTNMIEHLCLILGAVVLLNAEETYDTKYACGTEYPMDSVKSMYLNYDGNDVGMDTCYILFTIAETSDYKICVQPISLNLDCGTTIEYQEHFVAESINDGEFTCSMNGQTSYEQNCVENVDKFFIVIKTQNLTWDTDESASFHVYAEEKSKYSFGTSSSTGLIGWVISVPIVVIVVVCILCMVRRRNLQQKNRNTQVLYNITVGATAMPTGGPPHYTSGVASSQQEMLPQSDYPQSGYPHPAPPDPYNYQPVPQLLDGGMQATPALNPSAPPPVNK